MRRHCIRALAGRRFRPCTTNSRHYLPIAPNLLALCFVVTAPNRIWLADITYIATGEGWLYLAVVLNLVTRKIVGWAMRDHMRTEMPLAALMMAATNAASGSGRSPSTSKAETLSARFRPSSHCSSSTARL